MAAKLLARRNLELIRRLSKTASRQPPELFEPPRFQNIRQLRRSQFWAENHQVMRRLRSKCHRVASLVLGCRSEEWKRKVARRTVVVMERSLRYHKMSSLGGVPRHEFNNVLLKKRRKAAEMIGKIRRISNIKPLSHIQMVEGENETEWQKSINNRGEDALKIRSLPFQANISYHSSQMKILNSTSDQMTTTHLLTDRLSEEPLGTQSRSIGSLAMTKTATTTRPSPANPLASSNDLLRVMFSPSNQQHHHKMHHDHRLKRSSLVDAETGRQNQHTQALTHQPMSTSQHLKSTLSPTHCSTMPARVAPLSVPSFVVTPDASSLPRRPQPTPLPPPPSAGIRLNVTSRKLLLLPPKSRDVPVPTSSSSTTITPSALPSASDSPMRSPSLLSSPLQISRPSQSSLSTQIAPGSNRIRPSTAPTAYSAHSLSRFIRAAPLSPTPPSQSFPSMSPQSHQHDGASIHTQHIPTTSISGALNTRSMRQALFEVDDEDEENLIFPKEPLYDNINQQRLHSQGPLAAPASNLHQVTTHGSNLRTKKDSYHLSFLQSRSIMRTSTDLSRRISLPGLVDTKGESSTEIGLATLADESGIWRYPHPAGLLCCFSSDLSQPHHFL